MKILLALLMCLCLLGCERPLADRLAELGYSEEETEVIETLSEQLQERFLQEYDTAALKYAMRDDFIEEKLDEYLKYDGQLEISKLTELVNKDIVNDIYMGIEWFM